MTTLSLHKSNSFTDSQPQFPYASSEAKRHLGIPDTPAIHLAITDLAERLLALPYRDDRPLGDTRVSALRSASRGVREGLCFELVVLYYRIALGDFPDQAECDRVYAEGARTDWLGAAMARLTAEGRQVSPAVKSQATRYGWSEAM